MSFQVYRNPLPPLVTALPTSPADRQEVYFQSTAMASNGEIWHLRYNAASASSHKWEFLGGSELVGFTLAEESRANAAYGDLSGGATGPSVALPLAGDYDITIGARSYCVTNGAQGYMSYATASAAADADGFDVYALTGGVGTIPNHLTTRRKTGLTAVTITAKYKVSTGTAYFSNRVLRARPVRVS